ncbi:uncharacterized protein LOC110912053 [Helianthus annuus]|uniref:uncharacterized protein LOC110912053 n=1 Tax=Helianthus annuus TaxID=4232 RepID=UPI001652DF58|nr:uncharacterized protein LOC110912053 [Helianthus annuus]
MATVVVTMDLDEATFLHYSKLDIPSQTCCPGRKIPSQTCCPDRKIPPLIRWRPALLLTPLGQTSNHVALWKSRPTGHHRHLFATRSQHHLPSTADDLFPLFYKYGKVVDVFIPRDRRTGDSRGFAFVRYKYADETQKAVDKLDGRVVDGREIMICNEFNENRVRPVFSGPDREPVALGLILYPSSLRVIWFAIRAEGVCDSCDYG